MEGKPASTAKWLDTLRVVPDFPKPGIQFYDITSLLLNPSVFQELIDHLSGIIADYQPDIIAGIDARGFVFASAVAYKLQCGLALIRKQGKLPAATIKESYALEYGEATLELHQDTFATKKKTVLIDDLLATGGSAQAAIKLIEQAGGELLATTFIIELENLAGRDKLSPYPTHSLLSLDG